MERRLQGLERFMADPTGFITCPVCYRHWHRQDDLKMAPDARSRFVCSCGADLEVTPLGVTRK